MLRESTALDFNPSREQSVRRAREGGRVRSLGLLGLRGEGVVVRWREARDVWADAAAAVGTGGAGLAKAALAAWGVVPLPALATAL